MLLTVDLDSFDSFPAGRFMRSIDAVNFQKNRGKTKRALRAVLHPKPKAVVYREYMESDRWKSFRAGIIATRGSICERCGLTTPQAHVHHISYSQLGNESPEDVIVLCVPCHQKRHMDKKTFWK